MKRVVACLSLALPLAFSFGAASAQSLTGVSVEPKAAKVGQPVTVTTQFDVSKGLNCHARVEFGDGAQESLKVNQAKDATMTLQHTYAKPGKYTVKVLPRTKLPLVKCSGGDLSATVDVAAAEAAKPVAAAAPACPEGWKLTGAVSKKTGAFTCTAKAGTAAPAARLACPGSLSYFENVKKGQLGCRV